MRYSARTGYYRRSRRKKINLKKLGTIITVAVFIVLVFVCVNIYSLYSALKGSDNPTIWHPKGEDRTQVAMLGAWEGDVIACTLISLPEDKTRPVYLLSVPPQTLLRGDTRDSLSSLYSNQGLDPALSALEQTLAEIKIDYWFSYELTELPELLAALGNVKIDLEQGRTVTWDESDYVFAPGTNTITGTNALPLMLDTTDSALGENVFVHNKLLVAVFNDIFEFRNLGNLVENLRKVGSIYETNLKTRELARFRDTLAVLEGANPEIVLLPGRWLSSGDGQYWSTEPRLVELLALQLRDDLPAYNRDLLVIDVFNGNGVHGFAGRTAQNIRALNYAVGVVDNADITQQTEIYYLPEFHLAALELALVLECEAVLIQGYYEDSQNPVAVILGVDLNGGN